MKAFVRNIYGGPEVLKLQEAETPVPVGDQLLIRVFANSLNPADWHILRGEPFFARFTFGLFRPKNKVIGCDFAGEVIATGDKVKNFKTGDRVFGETLMGGAFAEYVAVAENACAIIPATISYKAIAGIPVAGLTALQAIVTHGKLKAGELVLINGASGGVGHFAVQVAKAYAATVTAVCSERNISFVRDLGADHVIAYDKENIHQHDIKYDIVIDANGNLSHRDYQRMGRRGVMIGFTTMQQMMSVLLKRSFSKFPLAQFTATVNSADLQTLALLLKDGKIRTHLDRIYNYRDIPAAITELEKMRTRGKVVIVWDDAGS